jgi:hypothetical protein
MEVPSSVNLAPQYASFRIDVEANPDAIAQAVVQDVLLLRRVRDMRGLSRRPLSRRTITKWIRADLTPVKPWEGTRDDFAQDDEVFQVWDLKQQKKTDMEIAKIVWPSKYKCGNGRDTKTGDKGLLAQRVHDYKERADTWITDYPKQVRHSMKVL